MQKFEQKFRVRMAKAGFKSFAAVAREAGCSGDYVRTVARGLRPSPELMTKLASALKTTPEKLWGRAA